MIPLVIDRSKWARVMADGSSPCGASYLLNEIGGMCCLGFACRQLGAPDEDLEGVGGPGDGSALPCYLDITGISSAIRLNDRSCSGPVGTDAEQEAKIATIFAKSDVEVQFVGETPLVPVLSA